MAAAIVDEQGRMLAIRRRDNSHWEPPGGVLELDESIHDGLKREVAEETGLVIRPGPLTGVYKNLRRGIVALVFRAEVVGGASTTTEEAAELCWLSPAEVRQLMDDAYAVRLLDALAGGEPAVRAHDGRVTLQGSPSAGGGSSRPAVH